ncbi:cyclase-like protein 2 [Quercus suber]|uniref:Cyclase-like protein 2 n=1 Tax=Quercus suber TaxID=58331 RepID=A0AAW0KP59_QUESU
MMKMMMMMMNKTKPHVLHLLLVLSCTWVLTVSATSDAYPSVSDCGVVDEVVVPVRREVYGEGKIFDISHRYREDMLSFHSDDGLGQFLWLRLSMKNGSIANAANVEKGVCHRLCGIHEGWGRMVGREHRYQTCWFREDMPTWDSVDGLGQFLRLRHSIKNGSLANVSELKYFSVHSGTHVDAPGHVFDHYFDAGFDVDTLDLELLNGPALLVDVPRDKNITAEVMKSLNIPKGIRRVIFRTLNTDRRLMWKKEFDTSFAGLMKDGAEWLAENTDIKLIGIDYLSVAAYVEAIPSHLVLLEARDIILVEGLKLDHIQPGIYSLHCLPLRLPGAEGSPARCILIK